MNPNEQNRRSWNAATRAHNSHKKDQARFLRDGGSTLFDEELELLGDLDGKKLLHLQCNAGQDSLSLAARGAVVTGVDISDEAIDFAAKLSTDSGIPATFQRDDVYDWLELDDPPGGPFDIVFASYGFLPWLSDLARWTRGAAAQLAPGGKVALIEFHPVATIFDEQWKHRWPYSSAGKPVRHDDGVGDYVACSGQGLTPSGYEAGVEGFENPHACYEYFWSPAELIQGFVDAGLDLVRFTEYPHSNGCAMWEGMRELPGNRFALPDGTPEIPLMFGLVLQKPAAC